MYEDLTVESIKSDIIKRLETAIDTREGSFANDMISAVAYKIWQTYQSLDAIIPIAFVDETSGTYIDKRCAEYGITRKTGANAAAILTINGTSGTSIPAGRVFLTADSLEFETNQAVTIINGTATVNVTAIEVGVKYNVDADTIKYQYTNLSGITSITNSAATGGIDAETDAALVKRLYEFLQNAATSGNVAHYKQWALSVEGVGNAKVMPLYSGNGTVTIWLIGTDNKGVDSSIVSACAKYIEDNRPIGATVTVESARELTVNVNASISIESYTTLSAVKTAFETALKAYFDSIAFSKNVLVYNHILYLLLDTYGVKNYATLTVNGGIQDITLDENAVPVIGTVVIS